MDELNPTVDDIALMKARLRDVSAAVLPAADRLLFRSNADFLGYLNEAHCAVDDIFDEYSEGGLPHAQAEAAFEAFQTIAAVALAQLALLRLQHPLLAVDTTVPSN